MKRFEIPELKATIFAKNKKEFEEKKAKLLARDERYMRGGTMKNYLLAKIKEF